MNTIELIQQLAQVSSLVNSFNPVPVLQKALTTKKTSQINTLRLSSVVIYSIMWLQYGIKSEISALINSSSFVGAMHVIYTTIALYLKKKYVRIAQFYAVIILLYCGLQYSNKMYLAILCTISQSFSGLTNIRTIRNALEQGSSVINLKQQFMTFPACILWLLVGITLGDYPNIICSGIDTIICVTCILLGFILSSDIQEKQDKKAKKQQ